MRLLINIDRRSLASSAFGLTGTTLPVVRQGDTQPLEVVLFRGVSGSVEAVDYPGEGWSLRVGVGELEAKPITGTFRLAYSGSETTELAAGSTATEVGAALNLLAPVIAAGGVSVEVVAGTDGEPGASFLVTFNNPGVRSPIVAAAAQLYPRSSTVSVEAVTGSATEKSKQLVRFVRTPVAVATDFDPLPSATASLESIVPWDGERAVTRLAIVNALAGSVVLTWHKSGGSSSYSAAIPVGATATEVQEAVEAMDNLSGKVTVYRTGISTFDIEVRHHPSSSTSFVNGFEVDATAAVKVPGYSGTISLATIEVEEMLGGSPSKAATLEVVLEDAGDEMTVLQIPCRVEGDLLEQTPASPLELDTPLGVNAAAATYLSKAGNLADIASPASARSNLGLGSMATESSSDYLSKAGNLSGIASPATALNNLGGAKASTIEVFGSPTSSGSFTWTKPAGAKLIQVRMIGAGGGGSSGLCRATSSARAGGGGGGGGASAIFLIPASEVGSTETIVVGAGGSGGVGSAVSGQGGAVGSNGGITSFGKYRAFQGFGSSVTTGGSAFAGTLFQILNSGNAGAGGNGQSLAGSAGAGFTGGQFLATGGGGGAGQAAGVTTGTVGGNGGSRTSGTVPSSYLDTLAGGSGGAAGANGTSGTMQDVAFAAGTGGGGGGYATGVATGNGGNGGWPGGGGGGGAGSDAGFLSGSGGNGANGMVSVITYF